MVMRILIAGLAALGAQALPVAPPEGAPTDAMFVAVRDALDGKLLDYPSARFREVRADRYRICGFVNAKNSLGAYTGWKRFGAMAGAGRPILYVDDDEMTEVFCSAALMATTADYSDRLTHR